MQQSSLHVSHLHHTRYMHLAWQGAMQGSLCQVGRAVLDAQRQQATLLYLDHLTHFTLQELAAQSPLCPPGVSQALHH